MNVLVYLLSKVKSLSIDKEQFSFLKFPSNVELVFAENEEEFKSKLVSANVVVCWRFEEKYFALAKELSYIITPAAGQDWIATPPLESNIRVIHSTFHGNLIANSLLGSIQFFNNNLDIELKYKRDKQWRRDSLPYRKLLREQNILIVGYGAIGRICALELKRFNCSIYGTKRSVEADTDDIGTKIIEFSKMGEVLGMMDHVVVLLPSHSELTRVLGSEFFRGLSNEAVIHSYGRGICLDEDLLYSSLVSNDIRGAALDVFEDEPLPNHSKLWELDTILITQHSSCFYKEYSSLFIEELLKTLEGIVA